MIQQTMDYISSLDPEVGASIREEYARTHPAGGEALLQMAERMKQRKGYGG